MTGHYLQEMLPSKFRSIALLNEDNTAVQMVALDASQESPPQSLTFPLEGTSMQFALAKGRVIWLPEETPLATFADMAMLAKQQIKSVLVTPLIIGSKVLGTLNLASERPSAYADVRAIGESFRAGDVVSMDLTGLTPEDAKRMIDFASGLTFGLQGTIERIGGKVFLLTPKGVEVAASVRSSLIS